MSSHATLDELLDLRDPQGDGSDPDNPLAMHVATCELCSAELERLQQVRMDLRALESPEPARDLWPDLRSELQQQRRRQTLSRWALAATAILALGLGGAWLTSRTPDETPASPDTSMVEALIDLQERSQHLDVEMTTLDLESRALRGWEAATIVALEDELALVDEELSKSGQYGPDHAIELWSQRLELQGAIVRVHLGPPSLQNL